MTFILHSPQENAAENGRKVQDFLLGISILLIGIQLIAWSFFLPQSLRGHTSFRQLYTAGCIVRTGFSAQLYDYAVQKRFQDEMVSPQPLLMPFIRPPFYALFFVPFSFLPYRWAYVVLLLLSLAALGVSVRLLRPWTHNLRANHRWLPILIFVSFVPIAAALVLGQDSILLLALLCASLQALNKGSEGRAGMLAGLGLFKFHLVIPVALLLLCWKRFRFFAGFLAVAAGLALASICVVPLSQLHAYGSSLLMIGKGSHPVAEELLRYPLPITMMANAHGLVAGFFGHLLAPSMQFLATGTVAVAILLGVAIAVPARCPPEWAVAIAITASVVSSYYLFVYDLSILLLPIAVLLNDTTGPTLARPAQFLWLPGVLVFLAPACLLLSFKYFFLVSLPVLLLLYVLVKRGQNNTSQLAAVSE